MRNKKLIIYTDGGARGNPGPAAAGVVIQNEQGEIVAKFSEYLGETTNNQAEYQAVILALEQAKRLGAQEIEFYLDSQLVVEQLNHNYKVKDQTLTRLFIQIWNLSQSFSKVSFKHISRQQNKLADRLVNQAIDNYFRKH